MLANAAGQVRQCHGRIFFAGKRAPTLDPGNLGYFRRAQICRRRLAGEGGGSGPPMPRADIFRGQARSYAGCCVGRFIKAGHGPVGAGLLANAVGQAKWMTSADRIRGQARSYTGCCVGRIIKAGHGPVGASLLANAVDQVSWVTQADRIRGQARSYAGCCFG